MNYPKFELDALSVGPDDIKPVLQCLIHTILFHRALGVVHPLEISSDLFTNICYMTVSNDKIYNEIEEKIDNVVKNNFSSSESTNTNSHSSENTGETEKVILLFYESKKNDKFWSLQSETKEYWERWDIKLSVEDKYHRSRKLSQHSNSNSNNNGNSNQNNHGNQLVTDIDILEENVKRNMIQIMENCNLNFNHLPKLPSGDSLQSPLSFSYELITDHGQQDTGYSDKIFGAIKKLVQNPPQANT